MIKSKKEGKKMKQFIVTDIARDVKKGILNQLRYGGNPKYLYCNPELLAFLIEFHNGYIIDSEGNVWFMGLRVVARRNVKDFYVR